MPLCHISSPLCYSLSVCVRVRVCELLNKHGCVVFWLADPRLPLSIQTPVVSLTRQSDGGGKCPVIITLFLPTLSK